VSEKADKELPARIGARTESALETVQKSRMVKLAPMRALLNNVKLEPNRAMVRAVTELDKCTKSPTDILEARRVQPKTVIDEPVLAKFLSDNPLPIIEKSMTLVLEPTELAKRTEHPLPIRIN